LPSTRRTIPPSPAIPRSGCARSLIAALCLAFVPAVQAAAQDGGDAIGRPTLPGIGKTDPRIRVDPAAAPWRAIGKLQATAGNLYESCTGTLIAPRIVLTAAHCLFNLRTRRYFPPSSLHFLVGYDGGRYAGHARGVSFEIGPGYDRTQSTAGSDWATLTIDAPLGTPDRVLALTAAPPLTGTDVTIGGYSQDHPLTLTADPDCRIVARGADANGRILLRHDCTATRGASGAPVLVRFDREWRIGGIDVAARRGEAAGLAAFPDALR
jgi:protease YdgD